MGLFVRADLCEAKTLRNFILLSNESQCAYKNKITFPLLPGIHINSKRPEVLFVHKTFYNDFSTSKIMQYIDAKYLASLRTR